MPINQLENALAGPERDHYFDLVQKFPLRPLRSDEELDQAVEVIDSLIVRGDLDSGEQDYLDALAIFVERYETEHHPMRPVSEAEMLRHLIDARGITQAQLARDVNIAGSTISEILSNKREMTKDHIRALARYFGVKSSVFNI